MNAYCKPVKTNTFFRPLATCHDPGGGNFAKSGLKCGRNLSGEALITKQISVFAILIAAALSASSNVAASVLFGMGDGRQLYTINQSTWEVTRVGNPSSGANVRELTCDWRADSFRLWGLDVTDNLYQIDPYNGQHTLIGQFSVDMKSVAFDAATNQLYGLSNGGLYQVDKNTAAATLVAPTDTGVRFITFGPTGTLYGNLGGVLDGTLVTIDKSTGAISEIGFYGAAISMSALAVRPEDSAIFGLEGGYPALVYDINSSTGKATYTGVLITTVVLPSIQYVYGFAFSSVPEPSAFALVFIVATVAITRRRCRRIV
jgi:hypothetical protein